MVSSQTINLHFTHGGTETEVVESDALVRLGVITNVWSLVEACGSKTGSVEESCLDPVLPLSLGILLFVWLQTFVDGIACVL